MTDTRALFLLLLAAACADAAPEPSQEAAPAADPEVLMEADRAFAADVAEGGSAAWASWFHPEGAMIQPGLGEITGHDAIREYMAGLDDPSVSLRWEPLRAEIAASGELGWTTGTYVSERTGDDAQAVLAEGRYVSIWRLHEGAWRVAMDLGNPTER